MKQIILFLSIFMIAACGSSDSDGDGGGGNKIDAKAACEATTAEEFFAALGGEFNIPAVDAFKEGGGHADSDTETFEDGEKYMVRLEDDNDLDLTIDSKNGEQVFTYNEEEGDTFVVENVGVETEMIQAYVLFATRTVAGDKEVDVSVHVPCEDDLGDPWFIQYIDASTDIHDDKSFSWRLDTGA